MGKSSKAPTPPDPRETAAAEAQYNRLDTYSPSGAGQVFGFSENGQFKRGVAPEDAQSAVKTIESEPQRKIREMLEPAAVDFTDRFIGDVNSMPDQARVKDRGTVASDIFNRNFSLMAPGIDQSNERMLTNLQARGIPMGGEAFNETYGDQVTRTQDTISRLAQDANIGAGQEQSRQYGLDAAERGTAMSELMAMMGGNYQPPSNVPSGQASQINYSGLVGQQYQAQMDQYNQSQQQKMGTASTLGSLGAALIKSTRHSKDIGNLVPPAWSAAVVEHMPVWSWQYKPEANPSDRATHIGPTAEDFHHMTGLGTDQNISVIDYLGLLMSALKGALQRIEMLERDSYERSVH